MMTFIFNLRMTLIFTLTSIMSFLNLMLVMYHGDAGGTAGDDADFMLYPQ